MVEELGFRMILNFLFHIEYMNMAKIVFLIWEQQFGTISTVLLNRLKHALISNKKFKNNFSNTLNKERMISIFIKAIIGYLTLLVAPLGLCFCFHYYSFYFFIFVCFMYPFLLLLEGTTTEIR